eukprot:10742230-Ditylum_brightwellii.AAC.1
MEEDKQLQQKLQHHQKNVKNESFYPSNKKSKSSKKPTPKAATSNQPLPNTMSNHLKYDVGKQLSLNS